MIRLITNDTTITNTATITGITAALLMALNLNLFILAYSLFITSSVLWSIYAYRNNNRQLLIMNIVFSLINLIGLIRFS
jgi:ribonuclease PH